MFVFLNIKNNTINKYSAFQNVQIYKNIFIFYVSIINYILESLRILDAQLPLLFILKIYLSMLFVFKSSVNKSWVGV